MDKKVLRQRMRRKQQQIRRRKMMRLGACALAVLLVLIFVIRGVIIPIANRIGGGSSDKPVEVQAETDETETTDEDGAVRRPLKSKSDLAKASQLTVGWHEDDNGRWYQNADGTYFASGMQEIDGNTYSFDDNGYVQTGLEYTDELLDCLEENNAHATFFMLGQNVVSWESTVQRMVDLGCEIGNHTWDHPSQTLPNMSIDDVKAEFQKTDDALQQACGQIATVARAPYGAANQDIYDAVQKPFFMWSLDTEDWKLMDATADYDAVMNGDLTDGSIILMHDIHEPSVQAALKLIPDLTAQGYKLVTVSELAEAKNVTLQNTTYSQFWDSQLEAGNVPGYNGSTSSDESTDGTSDSSDVSDGSEDAQDVSDGSDSSDSSDESGDSSDGGDSGDGSSDDGSSDDGSYDDGSSDDGSYDDSSYDDGSSDDGSYDDSGYSDEDSSGDDSYDTGYE